MSGPLVEVLDALAAGATSRADVARRTGLGPDVVDAAVEHLVRTGRVQQACATTALCPAGGCGGCPVRGR
jgi:DNA-binding IclR family transcriptional regulator